MNWKVGDELTGEQVRTDLPDGAVVEHVRPPKADGPGVRRTVGAAVSGMESGHRGVVGHCRYRIVSLPEWPVSRGSLPVEFTAGTGLLPERPLPVEFTAGTGFDPQALADAIAARIPSKPLHPAEERWAELGRLLDAPEDMTDSGALLELVKQRRIKWISDEYAATTLRMLTKGLEPLCPCPVGPEAEPQQECPLHGDQETFVAEVRELRAIAQRVRSFAADRGDAAEGRWARAILGEVEGAPEC